MLDFEAPSAPPAPPGGKWMLTLVDLTSILLSFFILVYAGTSLPISAWDATSRSLRSALAGNMSVRPLPPAADPDAGRNADADTGYLAAVIAAALADDPAITVDAFGDHLVIALARERVFYTQSGQTKAEAAVVLRAIVPHLTRLRLPTIVAVESGGGGDDVANRRLALARGRAMLAALRTLGAAKSAPVFVVTAPAADGPRRRRPCSGAAALGNARDVVVCLAGDGR